MGTIPFVPRVTCPVGLSTADVDERVRVSARGGPWGILLGLRILKGRSGEG